MRMLSLMRFFLLSVAAWCAPEAESTPSPDGGTWIALSSSPRGAEVRLDTLLFGENTPCMIPVNGKDSLQISIEFSEAGEFFHADTLLHLSSGYLHRIFLRLQKRETVLEIQSFPAEAEIFLDQSIGPWSVPDGKTPFLLRDLSPGKHRVSLMLPGYRDSTSEFSFSSPENMTLQISLENLVDSTELALQNDFLNLRKKRKRARVWLWASALPATLATVFFVLAESDYARVAEIHDEMENSSIRQGSFWESRKSNFISYRKRAEDRSLAAWSFTVLTTVLFGTGVWTISW